MLKIEPMQSESAMRELMLDEVDAVSGDGGVYNPPVTCPCCHKTNC